MSQVGISRPLTQQSLTGRLPAIQHPMSRMGSTDKMDIRGVSRSGDRPASQVSFGGEGRPLANEGQKYYTPRRSMMGSSRGRVSKSLPEPPLRYDSIPEGVEYTQGDPSKTRMPIFEEFDYLPPIQEGQTWNRADVQSRAELASRGDVQSRVSSRMSRTSGQQRLEIDELEAILKEKVKNSYFEVKKKFKDSDPEQKGNVSRDAFLRILVTTTNRPINQHQFSCLMNRFGFRDKAVINFTEFFSVFREVSSSDYPRWMDPVQRHHQEKSTLTASQVHTHLKEKAKQRVRDIADLIPQTNPDGSGHILRPEFRNVLNQMGFYMEDDEFEKLWSKYDTNGIGTINGENLMRRLGIAIGDTASVREFREKTPPIFENYDEASEPGSRQLRKREVERQRSLNIERWLKDKFREGFLNMKAAFTNLDNKKTGMVTHEQFLHILCDFGLKLEKDHLADFLARCSVQPTRTHVPYREFLHRFQDRSEGGMTHQVLINPKHRYNRPESPEAQSTFSALETQMLNMFQRDFLALLGTFHKIDKLGLDVISQEEFRAAIESRFELEMTEEQFLLLIDRVPLDSDGNVRYAEFMSQFDTRGKAKSLYTELKGPSYKVVPALPEDKSPVPPPADFDGAPAQEPSTYVDRLVVNPANEAYQTEVTPKRSPQEMFKLIKTMLKKNYQEVSDAFYEIDEQNTRRLTQEMMFQMFKRFNSIQPEFTRGEIRDLWKTFITNQDKTLDFLQFTRHFGYSLKSAAFPNAKIVPPRQGDSDFLIRSRKLNCAADMLQDSLRSKIDYMWEDLRYEFAAMDPYDTGYVNLDEFKEVLSELCVHLSHYELEMITRKFDKGDGRVCYREFLKPYAMRKQTWKHGNNMMSLLVHPNAELPLADIGQPPQKGLNGITSKFRQKLINEWKNMRRAFKKLDVNNQGCVSIPEFRSVLQLCNIIMDEEEVYQILCDLDENMSGKIPYNKFLSETFKPNSHERAKVLRGSAVF